MRDARKAQWQFGVVKVLLAFEVYLEIPPLNGVQLLIEPDYAGVAIRRLLLAEKEWSLVSPVDEPIAWRLTPGKTSNVVKMSVTCTISLLSVPALILPGQRIRNGVRIRPPPN